MGGLVFPPSNKDKAHFKDTILAIEDKKGSCVLEMHRYLIALYPGENINDKTSVLFYLTGKYDKVSRQTTNCKMAIKMENRPDDLWSASLPNNTAGLVVRSENKNNAKIKARQLVAVDESGKTLLVITPFGNHFRLNPSGEAMMIERFDGTWRACWSTFPLKPRDVLGAPLVTANVTTPRTFIDILAWEHFVREYNAGRCQTAERVRLVVETEIERLVNLRGKNQGSLRVHLRNQAAWYVFNKLRNYEHVTAPFLTDGKPPSNGGVFLDLNGPDQIDLYYTQERFPFRSNMPSDFRPEAGGVRVLHNTSRGRLRRSAKIVPELIAVFRVWHPIQWRAETQHPAVWDRACLSDSKALPDPRHACVAACSLARTRHRRKFSQP